MSMVRTPRGGGGGGGVTDHELLDGRRGVGADGQAWHLTGDEHKIVIQLADLPDDGKKYALVLDTSGAEPVVSFEVVTDDHEELENRLGKGASGEAYHLDKPLKDALDDLIPAGVSDHEKLGNRLGMGADTAAWHLSEEQHAVLIQLGLIPGDSKAYAVVYDGTTVSFAEAASVQHNALTGLQGGSTAERYHITAHEADSVRYLDRQMPNKPANIYPNTGDTGVVERPLFSSTPYVHTFGVAMYSYQMQIFGALDDETSVPPTYDTDSIETDLTIFRIPAGILLQNSSYKWRVRYQGENLAWSDWSDFTVFATETVFSSPFILQPFIAYPTNGGSINAAQPTISTSPYDSPSGLVQSPGDFQVSDLLDFSNVVASGTGMSAWQVDVPLSRGVPYYARARHKGDSGNVVSPWSPRSSFIVRELYRDTRIGIVLEDADNWVFTRVGRNYEHASVDGDYWDSHPIWSILEATRGVLVAGEEMVRIPAFYIRSGVVPHGSLAGKRCWMIDTAVPTQAELDDGWHLHGAFMSDGFGDQDYITISLYNAYIDSGVAHSGAANPTGSYTTSVNHVNAANAKNTNSSADDTRGWHLATYMEFAALKLLALLELASIQRMNTELVSVSTPGYRGIKLWATGSATNTWCNGMTNASALPPGGNSAVTMPELCNGANNVFYVERFFDPTLDTAPDILRLDDYLLPRSLGNTGGAGTNNSMPDCLDYITAGAGRATAMVATRGTYCGPFGFSFGVTNDGLGLLAKWS